MLKQTNHTVKVSQFGKLIDEFEHEHCEDCGTPVIEKREERDNGYVEIISVCGGCGTTLT